MVLTVRLQSVSTTCILAGTPHTGVLPCITGSLITVQENLDSAMEFYRKGVEQGIFRNDVNYNIVRAMVCEQMDLLLHSEICKSYSLGEIYETVVFMHMRGISTEKGLKIVDNFLLNLKGNEHNKYG